jgi:hypothetical protein
VYNMGGGPSCRITYYDMLVRTFNLFGLDGKKIMPRNWFTLRNFHCCWYADSDVLNSYTGHWRHSYDDYMKQVEDSAGSLLRTAGKIGGKIPLVHTLVRELVIRRYADPLHWIGEKDEEKIKAFFGSREVWENIGPWDEFVCPDACYDTVIEPYTGNDMRELAKSRGGEFLSPNPIDLDPFTKFQWKCAFGHEFDASPTLLRAGHWCPECAPPPWKWDDLCKSDPLLGTCYYNNHRPSESQCVEWLYCPNQ